MNSKGSREIGAFMLGVAVGCWITFIVLVVF